jgi:hypothetical protein
MYGCRLPESLYSTARESPALAMTSFWPTIHDMRTVVPEKSPIKFNVWQILLLVE